MKRYEFIGALVAWASGFCIGQAREHWIWAIPLCLTAMTLMYLWSIWRSKKPLVVTITSGTDIGSSYEVQSTTPTVLTLRKRS